MSKAPGKSLQKIANLWFVLFLIFFSTTAVISVYFFYKIGEIKTLKSSLLSQKELQDELFKSSKKVHAIYPHIEKEIGFVLNPHLKSSSWKAVEGEHYSINSLGIRGKKISRKRKGIKRILLVGDSMLFGWKLRDEEMLSAILTGYCAKRFPGNRFQFITVALPVWNIKSECAFLESHLDRLEPDFIVWSIVANDVQDVPGCVPPGILAGWNSPHKKEQAPFKLKQTFYRAIPLPMILDRWEENFLAIKKFSFNHRIQVLLLFWYDSQRPFFHLLRKRFGMEGYPFVIIPPKFTSHRSWKVSPGDGHPSLWANHILAAGLLGKLAEINVIPQLKFDTREYEIIKLFREVERKTVTPEEIEKYRDAEYSKIPTRFTAGIKESSRCILYGFKQNRLLKNGIMYLRNETEAKRLRLKIEVPSTKFPDPKLFICIRNMLGTKENHIMAIDSQSLDIDIPLPWEHQVHHVYEIAWNFNFSVCNGPTLCYCGKLVLAEFRE